MEMTTKIYLTCKRIETKSCIATTLEKGKGSLTLTKVAVKYLSHRQETSRKKG